MADPRDGFEIVAEFGPEDGAYEVGDLYGDGMWLCQRSTGSRGEEWDGPFAAVATPDGDWVVAQLAFVGKHWWFVASEYLTPSYSRFDDYRMWWSDDLLTWHESDFSDYVPDNDPDGFPYDSGLLLRVLQIPSYDSVSDTYFFLIATGVFLGTGSVSKPRLATTSNPASGWAIGGNPLAHPAESVGSPQRDFVRLSGGVNDEIFTMGRNGDTLFIIYGSNWLGPDMPDDKFTSDIWVAESADLDGPWTFTLLFREAALYNLPDPSRSSSVIPVPGGMYAARYALTSRYLSWSGGEWALQESFYDEDGQAIWAAESLAGPWTKLDIPYPSEAWLLDAGRAIVGNGVWLLHYAFQQDSYLMVKNVAFAGSSLFDLSPVSIPQVFTDGFAYFWYAGDGEWLGFANPNDEDFWPDTWARPVGADSGGGGGWDILID